MTNFDSENSFIKRLIGPQKKDLKTMLEAINVKSLDSLIEETIPKSIRSEKELDLDEGISENELLSDLKRIAKKNIIFKNYIGLGYYGTILPAVIQRNILENPGWYTSYTPYQAEISQGRLEALLNFQTMISEITKMDIANASLLDEGTAAAEAMTMLYRLRTRDQIKNEAHTFLVSSSCFPQTIEILKTRALPLGIKLDICRPDEFNLNESTFGILLQNPGADGKIEDYQALIKKARNQEIKTAVICDLLSLTLITPPGKWNADLVLGSTQRFGCPMDYGGPHAAYIACKEEYVRQMPGRIIGISQDSNNDTAYRMAIQTREQHIRREKATSNICTAQALLAIISGMYAIYHGAEGLKEIGNRVHTLTKVLEFELNKLGFKQMNDYYFDTLKIDCNGKQKEIINKALALNINFRIIDKDYLGISIDETTSEEDINTICGIFAKNQNKLDTDPKLEAKISETLLRKETVLSHPIFSSYHSETEMMRYIKSLENKDISLTTSMIPLGSCTMKLNAAVTMLPITWPEFANLHPFVPINQVKGYQELFFTLEADLAKITGLKATSLQPNSGAQGEYAGLLVIRAYQKANNQGQRNIVLIPVSAHGTNPASAAMVDMKIITIKCDLEGNIDINDLRQKANENKENLSCLMVTYPSTHGVFEENITEICTIIHNNGGQVYMDGANLNAQVGFTSPGQIGADVCHLNLHKTFGMPHGGGGPGIGPICVQEHLKPFLPGHPLIKLPYKNATAAVSSAPWGSAGILPIAYGYIKLLGNEGLKDASKYAILNANYIKERLAPYFKTLYTGKKGRVAHELIIDVRQYKKEIKIDVEDIAKRLIDYGFHAPTMSFPVPGTLMVEPTESESREELDRFCEAMISIHGELQEIADGKADPEDNPLKNAPHTALSLCSDQWAHKYSREKAAYPLPYLKSKKYWPPVGRIDNAFGDRNLVCNRY